MGKGTGKDGKVTIPVMASPEYKTNGPNTNYDLALLKWGLQILIDVQGEHGDAKGEALDPPPKPEVWKHALASLPFYPRDAKTGYNVAQAGG